MKQLDNKGFGVIEGLLVLVLVGIVGSVSFFVYKQQQEVRKPPQEYYDLVNKASQDRQYKTYTDTAKKFSFEYPSDWTVSYPIDMGKNGPEAGKTDYTKVSRQVNLVPAHGEKDNVVVVRPECKTVGMDGKQVSTLQDLKDRKDKFHTQQEIKINNYDGLYDKIEFKGDAEGYTDHTYYLTDGKSCILFTFRENYFSETIQTKWDDKINLAPFKIIVDSVRFN